MPIGSTSIIKNGEVIFNTADVKLTGTSHVWTPLTAAAGLPTDSAAWSSYQDASIAATAADLPAPSKSYTPWSGSSLGRVVVSPAPMEAVNFTEYDSELCIYAAEVATETLEAELRSAAALASMLACNAGFLLR